MTQMIHRRLVNKRSNVTNKQKNLRTAEIFPSLEDPDANVSWRYSSLCLTESCNDTGKLFGYLAVV